jgi:C1A family cysteine protease
LRFANVQGVTRHVGGWLADRPARDWLLPEVDGDLPDWGTLQVVPKVLDQGAIGRCTAAAAVGMLKYLDLLDDGQEREFSSLALYAFTRILEGTPLTEDSGAQIRSALKALQRYGTCLYEQWPDTEKWTVAPTEAAQAAALEHQALFYYRCPTLKTVLASILQGFPVEFGFSCPENLFSDHAARFGEVFFPETSEKLDGGHAVYVIGYDINRPIGKHIGAVKCRNSWGSDWGLGGDFWLPMEFWHAGLATDCWTLRRAEL